MYMLVVHCFLLVKQNGARHSSVGQVKMNVMCKLTGYIVLHTDCRQIVSGVVLLFTCGECWNKFCNKLLGIVIYFSIFKYKL